MWICLNDGFISAVQTEDNPNLLKVRARRIEHLKSIFPGHKIQISKGTDYKYRVFVTKDEMEKVMLSRIKNIDYSNFKNSVKDNDLHDLYEGFWFKHYRYQK